MQDAKFSVPRPGPGSIRRIALLHAFRAARDRRLISIVAPPGYGKTTALAQLAADHRYPFAWVMVDDSDNDPVTLFSDMAVALDHLGPLDPVVLDRLGASGATVHSLVGRLLAAAAERATPVRVVLDDAHRITDRTCLDALAELIVRLPPGGQLVVVSRLAVGLPLPRWRAQGAILEIGMDELAFDADETAKMLHQFGMELTTDQIDAIHQKSEGWPAGIYLAATASRKSGAVVSAAPSGGDRYIAEYLRAEVLQPLDSPTMAFLRRTAILERLSGPICDAVADVHDAARTLELLARTNHLVMPLDERGAWYRLHTLLREHLLADLARGEPAIVRELHERASLWFQGHGQIDSAIDHAFAAGDTDRAARLFGGVVMELHYSGRTATARAILDRFDHHQLQEHPWMATLGAISAMFSGEVEVADRMEAIVDHSTFDGRPPDGSASFESLRATMRVFRGRGGVSGMRTNADIAVEAEPPSSVFRGWALNCSALASMAVGDGVRADRDFVGAVAAARAAEASEDEQLALAGRAMLAIASGDWVRARSLTTDADAVIRSSHLDAYALTVWTRVASARVAIHGADLAGARHGLATAASLRPLLTQAMPWFSVRSLLELAHAHLELADAAGARAAVRQAEGILMTRRDLGILAEEIRTFRRQLQGLPDLAGGASALTTAELRVLAFLPLHLSFREIGERLGVKPGTIKTHALSVYGKLGANSRSQAVAVAIAAGLIGGSLPEIW